MAVSLLVLLSGVGSVSARFDETPVVDVESNEPLCRIVVVDQENGWPVPLVQLRTNHGVTLVTDNAGVVAFDLPELMNVPTWLAVAGDGYEVAADGFGFRGVRVTPTEGNTIRIEVTRTLPGKRLGRLTGAGMFAESQRFGEHADWHEQGILGCDSVQNVVHNGRLHWGWGDTTLAGYPLGIFHMLGATTELRPLDSFKPPMALRFDYVRDDAGQPRGIAKMPGPGPTWLSGYVSLTDREGTEHLGATYVKIKPPLEVYEAGLCVWNEQAQAFEQLKVIWRKSPESLEAPPYPNGHPIKWRDEEGRDWLLFGDPFPALKCPATYEAWQDVDQWETLQTQETVPVFARRGRDAVDSDQSDVDVGNDVRAHRGAIAWNGFRQKWVTVFTQVDGKTSRLGEIWYAEADSPFGPWQNAVHVVTHDHYSFYNPQLHAEFTPDNSPILLFEATYTRTFSRTTTPTPRYNYNQILYRLDLDEPAFDFGE